MNKNDTFHKIFSEILENNLKLTLETHQISNLTTYACTLLYQTIFNTIVEAVSEAKLKLSNESVNYVAQQYYDGVLINNRHELDPNIFNARAKIENIPTQELVQLAAMLKGTDFVFPIIQAMKSRN